MRSIFKKTRRFTTPTIPVDARPKGIHHTVRIDAPYNETWNHIWAEIKKISVSSTENVSFERNVSKSYAQPAYSNTVQEKVTLGNSRYCNPSGGIKIQFTLKNENPVHAQVENNEVYVDSTVKETENSKGASSELHFENDEHVWYETKKNGCNGSYSYTYHVSSLEEEALQLLETDSVNDLFSNYTSSGNSNLHTNHFVGVDNNEKSKKKKPTKAHSVKKDLLPCINEPKLKNSEKEKEFQLKRNDKKVKTLSTSSERKISSSQYIQKKIDRKLKQSRITRPSGNNAHLEDIIKSIELEQWLNQEKVGLGQKNLVKEAMKMLKFEL